MGSYAFLGMALGGEVLGAGTYSCTPGCMMFWVSAAKGKLEHYVSLGPSENTELTSWSKRIGSRDTRVFKTKGRVSLERDLPVITLNVFTGPRRKHS